MLTTPRRCALALLPLFLASVYWHFTAPEPAAGQDKKQDKFTPPATLLKDVKAPKDYQVTIFASPPTISYPTCLACAPTGEVFVGVDQNGSLDAKPDRGKIVRLVDTKGLGKADQVTEFAKVDSPRGLVVDGKTVYCLAPPNLYAFHDDNGTGIANRQEILVKGIGKDLKFRGADHTTNGIRMGIDGWIYVACGDYGFTKAVGKDGKELQLYGGGIVRVRPDGTELEVVVRGTRNIYDVAIDPLMNLFTRDNTNDGDAWDVRLNHDTPLANYGYPSLFVHFPDEILQPLADYGGGSPTGAIFLDEPGFPAEVGRTLLTCEWGRNGVMRHPLKAKGATFTIEQKEFIHLTRPTGIAVDGEGHLYVASWRGATFTYNGPDAGYIARITYPSIPSKPFPDVTKVTEADLAEMLASDSHTRRLAAQREILRRGKSVAMIKRLEALVNDAKAALPCRVAGIFTYTQLLGGDAAGYLKTLATDEALREFALHALADRKADAAKVPAEVFAKHLDDKNPRVRLQAIIGMARAGQRPSAKQLIPRLGDSDPVVAHTAVQALIALHATDECLAELDRGGTPLALPCIFVLQHFHEKAVVDGLQDRFDALAKDDPRRPAIFRGLCRLYVKEAEWTGTWWGTRPDTSGPYFKAVTWSESDRIGETLKGALAKADANDLPYILPELVRHKVYLPGLMERVAGFAKENATFRLKAVDLLLSSNRVPKEALPVLEEVAKAEGAAPAVRARALRGLTSRLGEPGLQASLPILADVQAAEKPPTELAAVLREFTTDFAHAKKLPLFTKAADSDDAKKRGLAYVVLLNLRGNKNATKSLTDTVDKVVDKALSDAARAPAMLQAIATTRSDVYSGRVLALAKSDRPEVQKAAAAAVKTLGLDRPPPDRKDTVAGMKYDDVLARAQDTKGDAALGSRLFLKQNCIACHTVTKGEPVKGPFLGDVAARYKRAELIESILKPNAKIAQGFETHIFTMNNGKIHTGFVVREAGDEVEIRDNTGLSTVLRKKDIDDRKQSPLSVMPEGLVDNLTVQELASILAYLESLNAK
jgi:putative membrane-bound dehydrogenase-like protein